MSWIEDLSVMLLENMVKKVVPDVVKKCANDCKRNHILAELGVDLYDR
jgi:hypothetical protein